MDNICVVVLILLYNIKDVGATCGHLTYQEPAIQGRNVTFVFRPNTFKKNNNVTVRYDKTSIIYRNFPFDINDEVYYIHLDTTVDDLNNSYIFVKYGNCFTDWRKLTLMNQSEKGQTTIVDSGHTTIIDSGQTTILESGHKASGNAFLDWIAAGFGGLVLLTATVVLITLYLRKRKKRAEKPAQRNDPDVAQYVTREDSSTLSEEVNGTDVVKPRTVMSNTEGAVTKSKEKTTGALIYADLDIELLEAARKARKEQPQSAPTEYADIRFATRSQFRGQEN
ncbi:uncharacterized protein LOC128234252 [Mya arenaria]|uniref:uncharacterized protein LOC128234252 n=1 Tax=Mya arenaria TaxID=6604 RepID=UPI0022E625A0|nr:uncharacterized protein LOC128234252 [Mya arenaria]